MSYGILDIFKLVGSLALFIYGMKIMSEGIQKVAGEKLRDGLALMTTNKFGGVLTGFLTTAVIQSSSATTVMVVSFVNAGLLKLRQAIGVIMGANIGTTITAVLIIFFGFSKFSIANYTLPMMAVALPLLFNNKERLMHIGEFLMGFALLFMGLDFLKNAVPDLRGNPEVLEWITALTDYGFFSVILFVLIGTLLTVIVQSSSAAMAITLVMCDKGWIPFEMAAAIVLGENIGTTITANLAAMIGNVFAKRAARAHFIFNVFGVFWMLLIYFWYLKGVDALTVYFGEGSPLHDTSAIKWGLTYFHISFNILNTLILVWFVDIIEKVVTRMVPTRGDDDEVFKLEYIGSELVRTAELALLEVRKEVALFGKRTIKVLDVLGNLITEEKENKRKKLFEKIEKIEDIGDRMEEEIADYVIRLSEGRLSYSSSHEIRTILSVINDLERISDLALRMGNDLRRKTKAEITFSKKQEDKLAELISLLDTAAQEMLKNLNMDYEDVDPVRAEQLESKVNTLVKKMNKQHLHNIENKEYDIRSGIIYRDVMFNMERIGDHLINITNALSDRTSRDAIDPIEPAILE